MQHGETLPERSELALRARKVRPGYAEGPLMRAAWVPNQAEAELVQGLLLEEGIPSLARRSGGFDVPDFLAAGPRDIMVPAAGLDAALELLGDRSQGRRLPEERHPAWMRALAVTLALIVAVTFTATRSAFRFSPRLEIRQTRLPDVSARRSRCGARSAGRRSRARAAARRGAGRAPA